MKEIGISSHGLRIMTRIARQFATQQGIFIKLSNPDALYNIIEACKVSNDPVIKANYKALNIELNQSAGSNKQPFSFNDTTLQDQ